MSDRWAALRRACADDFVPVARDVRVLLAERDELLALLREAKWHVAAGEGASDERCRYIDGLQVRIDAALARIDGEDGNGGR